MTASVPFAIDVLSKQAALLATPGIDPKTEVGIKLSAVRVRCVMADMEATDIAHTDNWRRLGELVETILNPAAASEASQAAE